MNLLSKLLILLLVVTAASVEVRAQGGSIWYFGEYAGVDFNTTPPTPLYDGALNTFEGCATLTDNQGAIILYTDGVFVYNRLHQQMPNGFGLLGHSSSTQSAIIVPQPGNDSLYYIFTTGASVSPTGPAPCAYSVVNINLNNGLGDVTVKNVVLQQSVSEQLSAVKSTDGTAFWIICKEWLTNNFSTYYFDAAGVNPTPVVSSFTIPMPQFFYQGQLKFSPDGTRVAQVYSTLLSVMLFDFDASSGVLSNEQLLPVPGIGSPYGVEFSASGRYLYASKRNGLNNHIYQWDLVSNNPLDIVASRQTVNSTPDPATLSALQLAQNNKIYVARSNTTYLGVINNPELPGAQADYVPLAVNLAPKICRFGLPTFNQSSFFAPFTIQVQNFCLGAPTQFTASGTLPLTGYSWNFGDPASGTANTSTAASPVHTYQTPGQYTVTFTGATATGTHAQTQQIEIIAPPVVAVSPGGPITLCADTSQLLQVMAVPGASYQWFQNGQLLTNQTQPDLTVSASGLYHLQVTGLACPANSDSVQVTVYPLAAAEIIAPLPHSFCANQGYVLNGILSTGNTYQWLYNGMPITGENQTEIFASDSGAYQLVVSQNGLCPDTSVAVVLAELPLPEVVLQTPVAVSFCSGLSTALSVLPVSGATYQWFQNGQLATAANQPEITVSVPGSYQVQVTLNGCSDTSVTVAVTVQQQAVAVAAADGPTTFCEGQSVQLNASQSIGNTFLWLLDGTPLPAANTPEITATQPGSYQVVVSSNGLCPDTSDALSVTTFPNPASNLTLSGAPEFCAGNSVTLSTVQNAAYQYQWLQNGVPLPAANSAEITVTEPGVYLVQVVTDHQCAGTSEEAEITVHPLPQVGILSTPGPDCGGLVTLTATGANSYLWSTGQATSFITVPAAAAVYSVTGTDANNCRNEDTEPVEEENCAVILPNIITSNGDGLNDALQFTIPVPDFDLRVVSRWGKVVFEQVNYSQNQNWQAEGITGGLYYYQLTGSNGQVWKGWVEIVR